MFNFTDGWKTYAAAVLSALAAVGVQMGWLTSEQMQALLALVAALGFTGMRRAVAKLDEKWSDEEAE